MQMVQESVLWNSASIKIHLEKLNTNQREKHRLTMMMMDKRCVMYISEIHQDNRQVSLGRIMNPSFLFVPVCV